VHGIVVLTGPITAGKSTVMRCTLNPKLFNLNPTPCTLNPTPLTLNPTNRLSTRVSLAPDSGVLPDQFFTP